MLEPECDQPMPKPEESTDALTRTITDEHWTRPTSEVREHGATVGRRRRRCADVARRTALAGSYGDLRGRGCGR